jgi:hypothetical protein
MNAWDSLPNGKNINIVLDFVRNHPNAARGAARDAARGAAWGEARGAAWGEARGEAWDAARGAARDAAWDAAWGAAWGAARYAISALVAWDYAGDLFTADLSVVELAAHGGDPAATLLLPLKRVIATHNGGQNEPA